MQLNDLMYEAKNAYNAKDVDYASADEFCKGYKNFMNLSKTEREATYFAVEDAKKHGFIPYDRKKKYSAGDKVYYVNRNKSVILAVIGTEDIENGANIVVAHIDSPRLDIKQRPLYEEASLAYFKTHYYGGVKKYQWTALPLALHGVIIKKDGTSLCINLGEDEDEPTFYISDLMPHIAKNQMDKPLATAISGEGLNVIVGSIPLAVENNAIKLSVLKAMNEKYGITEEDLITAELCVVPAGKARDVGFDRGMISAYGHDDRVCAYPSMKALFDTEAPRRTCVCIFADKEEIGSNGVTGVCSFAYKHFLQSLCKSFDADFAAFCENSICLSADVAGAFDSCYADAYDPKNSAYVNGGVVITKYSGARGKSGSSDASAELVHKIVSLFNKEGVAWQTGEYGKVDEGSAGTVSSEISVLNIDVLDVGVALLSMHSPYELASKADIFAMYKAAKAFFTL